jgi:type VI secretion system secreted protein VgrG
MLAEAAGALAGIAALGGALWAPTQDTRLLRLHTPLGPQMLVPERVQVDEGIGPDPTVPGGLRIELTALAADAHIDIERLIGQPVLLELMLADGSWRPWHAHVAEFGLMGADGGLARYRLLLQPWLALLAHRHDSWVFQHMSVPEIIDEVLGDHVGQGALMPSWRWALEDPSAWPQRSLCIQYQESDLAFIERLMREEGLIAWFEHQGQADEPGLGAHTLVLADHNGAFAGNPQALVRFTGGGLGLSEDSLTGWRREARTRTQRLSWASGDHRSRGLRPVEQRSNCEGGHPGEVEDVPGAYAYPHSAHGERMALRQMQAIEASGAQVHASGPWRQAACGTHFSLSGHPQHSGLDPQRDCFVVLRAIHRMRNNLWADALAQLTPPTGDQGRVANPVSNDSEEPLHHCELLVQPLALPVRPPLSHEAAEAAQSGHAAAPPPLLKSRPTLHGTQTAIVVGAGPVLTDRDHRIKLQFHWQRGASGSGREPHPTGGNNAPASDASGTWVRVAQSVAGANWGANFVPRVGQEVLVNFVGGDIDRPVVVGSVYNGRGQADAQGNQVASGMAGSTGNAPAWFPGSPGSQGHDHPAALAGHKSQELATSASGIGGHNQLVLDDSPGQGRIELASTAAQARLQMGHLRHQQDNQLLNPRGHGLDLSAAAHGALRAGSGLLLSTHARGAQAAQMDAAEPQQQLATGRELLRTLTDSAVQHQATLAGQPAELPSDAALTATDDSLAGAHTLGGSGDADIGGGLGTVPAWGRPDLLLASPAGVVAHTPTDFIATSGSTASLTAGHDIAHIAQGHHALAAKDGLVLYTYGLASDADKLNPETGLKLHAGCGNVNLQAQTGAANLAADQAIDVASTQGMVRVTAPTHVLLTAAGAAIDISGDSITLKAPGNVFFRASMKEWAGGGSANASLSLTKLAELKGCAQSQIKGLDAITEF